MAKVLFKRYETDAEAQASNIVDGQFIVTKEGTSYTDYGTDRVAFGGTLDTQMSDSSINGVQNKVIKEYVDDEVQTAKDYSDSNLQEAKDYTDEKETYSTTETVIGKWINGKPIYRKIINFGNLPNNTSKDVAHNISNIDNFVKIYGIAKSSSNQLPLPYVNPNNVNYGILIQCSTTNITAESKYDRSNYTAYIILEYTKNN